MKQPPMKTAKQGPIATLEAGTMSLNDGEGVRRVGLSTPVDVKALLEYIPGQAYPLLPPTPRDQPERP